MPTQVPPGSSLAVKQYAGGGGVRRRRVKARGPRMLKYAGGGMVLKKSDSIRESLDREYPTKTYLMRQDYIKKKSVRDSINAEMPKKKVEPAAQPPGSKPAGGVRG